eukprot:3262932-Rhodomonas_salina.1
MRAHTRNCSGCSRNSCGTCNRTCPPPWIIQPEKHDRVSLVSNVERVQLNQNLVVRGGSDPRLWSPARLVLVRCSSDGRNGPIRPPVVTVLLPVAGTSRLDDDGTSY